MDSGAFAAVSAHLVLTEGLRLAYPGGAELAFADVQMPAGAVLLLRGASGSGKSTWLSLLAGLRTASGGRMVVAGQDLAQLPQRERDAWRGRTVGFLPQRLHLSDALSARENVALSYWAAGLAENADRIDHVLNELGLAQLAHAKPQHLSGGQAQRVALARALVLSPPLLVADEPTASLDDSASEQAVQLLLRSAQSSRAALVIATHDARVARALQSAHKDVAIFDWSIGQKSPPIVRGQL